MQRGRADELLLGEWACLAALAEHPSHGYDVAQRLAPGGDLGRVWTLSRALTYRALEQLGGRGLVAPVATERGHAGGTRTVLAVTPLGRAALDRWLAEPVPHLRDVRSALILKLVVCGRLGRDRRALLESQRTHFAMLASTERPAPDDPVAIWRAEHAAAVLRFIDRLLGS